MHQIQSLHCLSSAILAKHPDAATLEITQNEDGENQYDRVPVTAADRTVLEGDDIDEGRKRALRQRSRPVGLPLYALDLKNDDWATDVAEFDGKDRRYTRRATIDLKAAVDARLPQ